MRPSGSTTQVVGSTAMSPKTSSSFAVGAATGYSIFSSLTASLTSFSEPDSAARATKRTFDPYAR